MLFRSVDARDRNAFAAAHIPGALNIELTSPLAAYVGWLLPYDSPIALVADGPDDLEDAALQLFRIGWSRVVGALAGGVEAWRASGRPVRSYSTTRLSDVEAEVAGGATPLILDVRQPVEWRDHGIVPASTTIFVVDLPKRLEPLHGSSQITVLCKSGQRAAIAASILDGAGIPVRLVAEGGAPDWRPLEAASTPH